MRTFAYTLFFGGTALVLSFGSLYLGSNFRQNIAFRIDSPREAATPVSLEAAALEAEVPAMQTERQADESSRSSAVLFVGDIMLDRGVARHAERYGKASLMAGTIDLLQGVDAVVGNHEGTMTNEESVAQRDNSILRFTFDPGFASILKEYGFTAVSLANNHSLDFGQNGYVTTRRNLGAAGIKSFGSAVNTGIISTKIAVEDTELCLVGYHDLYVPNASSTLTEVRRLDPVCPHIAVFAHWGDEYAPRPNARQRMLARQFIDAGADLVIGVHPHVVQPVEVYKGRVIFYSLGNFVFDQDFSYETMHGATVKVIFEGDATRFKVVPVSIVNGAVSVASAEDRDRIWMAMIDDETDSLVASSLAEVGEFVVR